MAVPGVNDRVRYGSLAVAVDTDDRTAEQGTLNANGYRYNRCFLPCRRVGARVAANRSSVVRCLFYKRRRGALRRRGTAGRKAGRNDCKILPVISIIRVQHPPQTCFKSGEQISPMASLDPYRPTSGFITEDFHNSMFSPPQGPSLPSPPAALSPGKVWQTLAFS